MLKFIKWAVLIAVFFTSIDTLEAQSKKGTFRDTTDNAIDLSKFLLELHGFLPIISPITEPAVGYEAAAVGVYFIPKKPEKGVGFQMPDIADAGGGYTQNGTWFAGGGYLGFWKKNSIWYRGILGYGDINLNYYGNGGDFLSVNLISFNLISSFLLQQVLFRIGQSKFMIGGNYVFSKTKVTLFEESDISWLDPYEFDPVNSGVTLLTKFESFNNILSPGKGVNVRLYLRSYYKLLGSDKHSQRLTLSMVGSGRLRRVWQKYSRCGELGWLR